MGNLFAALKDAAMRPVQAAMTRLATDATEFALIGVFALPTLGFAIATLHVWLAHLWGPLAATGAMAAMFLVMTLIAVGVRMATAASRRKEDELHMAARQAQSAARQSVGTAALLGDQVARLAGLVGTRERLVLSAARHLARQSNPWVLVAAAVLSGFVGGRMLDRS